MSAQFIAASIQNGVEAKLSGRLALAPEPGISWHLKKELMKRTPFSAGLIVALAVLAGQDHDLVHELARGLAGLNQMPE